jgi:hypothetical protein
LVHVDSFEKALIQGIFSEAMAAEKKRFVMPSSPYAMTSVLSVHCGLSSD